MRFNKQIIVISQNLPFILKNHKKDNIRKGTFDSFGNGNFSHKYDYQNDIDRALSVKNRKFLDQDRNTKLSKLDRTVLSMDGYNLADHKFIPKRQYIQGRYSIIHNNDYRNVFQGDEILNSPRLQKRDIIEDLKSFPKIYETFQTKGDFGKNSSSTANLKNNFSNLDLQNLKEEKFDSHFKKIYERRNEYESPVKIESHLIDQHENLYLKLKTNVEGSLVKGSNFSKSHQQLTAFQHKFINDQEFVDKKDFKNDDSPKEIINPKKVSGFSRTVEPEGKKIMPVSLKDRKNDAKEKLLTKFRDFKKVNKNEEMGLIPKIGYINGLEPKKNINLYKKADKQEYQMVEKQISPKKDASLTNLKKNFIENEKIKNGLQIFVQQFSEKTRKSSRLFGDSDFKEEFEGKSLFEMEEMRNTAKFPQTDKNSANKFDLKIFRNKSHLVQNETTPDEKLGGTGSWKRENKDVLSGRGVFKKVQKDLFKKK